jgi:hypothetical protein
MPYHLEALILPAHRAATPELESFPVVPLEPASGLALLPLTGDAKLQVGASYRDELIGGFLKLGEPVRRFAAGLSLSGPVLYLYAEYDGGLGTQDVAIWNGGPIVFGPLHTANHWTSLENEHFVLERGLADGAINRGLRHLGVRATAIDEFETVGLHRFRSTEEWGATALRRGRT